MHRTQAYDSNYYQISNMARRIGESLLRDCPQNDCVIYRNLYDDYTNLVADYCQGAALLSDVTLEMIYCKISKIGRELERMRVSNHAIQSLLHDRPLYGQQDNKPLCYAVTADDIKDAVKAARELERQSASSGSNGPMSMPCSNRD